MAIVCCYALSCYRLKPGACIFMTPKINHLLNRKWHWSLYAKPFFAILFSFILFFHSFGANITSTAAGGNWNATGSWVGSVVPVAGDVVTIDYRANITVTANAACASITWSATAMTASRALTINSGTTLTVSGNITMVSPAANWNRTVSVAGNLFCANLTMPTTSGNSADCILSIATTGVVTISNDLIMATTFARNHVDMTGNAVINIGGDVGTTATPTAQGGGFTTPPSTSTINLNGSSIQNVFLYGGASSLGILKINNTAGVTNRIAFTTATLTIGDLTSNSIFKDSGYQVTSTGTLNLDNNSFFKLGRAAVTTIFPAFATRNINAGTTVEFMAGITQVVSITPAYSNLTLSGVSKTISAGTLTVGGDLTINTGATFNGGANNPVVNLKGNFSNSGTFTSGTGLFTMNGTVDQTITSSSALTFNGSLTIANSGGAIVTDNNAAITIGTGDNLTINSGSIFYLKNNIISGAGTFTLSSGGTLGIGEANGITASGATGNVQTTTRNFNTGANYIYNGIVNQATGSGLPATVNDLTIDNAGAGGSNTVTLGSNVSVSSNLTVSTGIFDLVGFTANRSTAGGTLTVSNGTQLIIGGTNTLPSNYSTHVIGATSTVEYAGTTTTVAALNSSQVYGNLTISGSGVTTTASFSVAALMSVSGSFIASAGTVTMSSTASSITNSGTLSFFNLAVSATPSAQSQYSADLTISNTLTVSGATNFSPASGTITLSGATGSISNTSGTLAFFNVTMSGTTISATGNFSVVGTMQVDGTFAPSATTIVSGAGTLNGSGTVRVTRIVATPSFSAQYTISTKTLASLTVNYIGAGAQIVSAENYGSLTISTNGTRTVTFVNGGTIGVSGVFTPTTTTTTYVVTGNTFDYNGSGAQTIAPFTYNILNISNAGVKSITVSTTVTCLNINLNGAATLDIPSSANALVVTQ